MKYKMIVSNGGEKWQENYDDPRVSDDASAHAAASAMLERFNATLYQGEKPRTLVSASLGGDGILPHAWRKTNVFSLSYRGSIYDTCECTVCGCTGRRYGVSGPLRDRKWKAAKWRYCPGIKAEIKRKRETE